MKKLILLPLTLIGLIAILYWLFYACPNSPETIKLWDESVKQMGGNVKEYAIDKSDLNTSEIDVYLPNSFQSKKTAVIICPGGAYAGLMLNEPRQLAKWLQSKGYIGVVLKYRMPNGRKDVPLADLQQTIRFLKFKSEEWDISPDRIAVAGLSAGGHLAATASTHFNDPALRPAFTILVYPVISFKTQVEKASLVNLLGDNFTEEERDNYSMETQVSENTPPAILFLSDNDGLVPSYNSILYYTALRDKGVSAALYVFPVGDHGWGFTKDFEYNDEFFSLLDSWLQKR